MNYTPQLRKNLDGRWDFLNGVLPHGINPTDIDLVIERRSQFLVLEGKHEGATFGTGQRRFYDALSAVPGFTVVHFYGTPPDVVVSFGGWGGPAQSASTEDLRTFVRLWFADVEEEAAK